MIDVKIMRRYTHPISNLPMAVARLKTCRRKVQIWFCIDGGETDEQLQQLAKEVFYVSGVGTQVVDKITTR